MNQKARLYVLSGPDVGRSFALRGATLLGRGSDCQVRMRGSSISRRHARFEPTAAGWVVSDLDSTNGVAMRGRRIERASLTDHDEIRLGEVRLRFRIEGGESRDAGPAGAPRVAAGLRSATARAALEKTPRTGALRSDLGQRPGWMQALAVIVALAVAGGLFWLSFEGVRLLRSAS